jgi:RHS repeat-associated protein
LRLRQPYPRASPRHRNFRVAPAGGGGTAISVNTYNALGQRVRDVNTANTTDEAYGAGGNLLWRYTGNSSDPNQRPFVPFSGGILAEHYSGGTIFDHPDEIGSATTSSDYTGNNLNEKLYYAFGESWTGAAIPSFNMHQTFAQLPDYDAETDQYNTANRHYSPSGRWMSPDPGGVKVFHLDNPQTWNLYAYVANNPTTADPSGLDGTGMSVPGMGGLSVPPGGWMQSFCDPGGASCDQFDYAATGSNANGVADASQTSGETLMASALALPFGLTLTGGEVGAAIATAGGTLLSGGAVVGASWALFTSTADVLTDNAKGREQLSAITSVVAVENAKKLNAASSDETKGGAPEEKKDRTPQGKQDNRESIQSRQKANVKAGKAAGQNEEQGQTGGWRIRDNRTSQEEQHELDRVQDLSDAEEKFKLP